jgi:hypothetical protein
MAEVAQFPQRRTEGADDAVDLGEPGIGDEGEFHILDF